MSGSGFVRILVVIVATILFIMAANMAWQYYHCEQHWNKCDPLSFMPCSPVSITERQWHDYERMAKKEKP